MSQPGTGLPVALAAGGRRLKSPVTRALSYQLNHVRVPGYDRVGGK